MGNMSYCRFENTLADLQDCHEHMDDDDLSDTETQAREEMLSLIREIASDYLDMIPGSHLQHEREINSMGWK